MIGSAVAFVICLISCVCLAIRRRKDEKGKEELQDDKYLSPGVPEESKELEDIVDIFADDFSPTFMSNQDSELFVTDFSPRSPDGESESRFRSSMDRPPSSGIVPIAAPLKGISPMSPPQNLDVSGIETEEDEAETAEQLERKLALKAKLALRRGTTDDLELLGALAKANLHLGLGLDAEDVDQIMTGTSAFHIDATEAATERDLVPKAYVPRIRAGTMSQASRASSRHRRRSRASSSDRPRRRAPIRTTMSSESEIDKSWSETDSAKLERPARDSSPDEELKKKQEMKLVLLQNIALRRGSASDKKLLGALAKADLHVGIGLDAEGQDLNPLQRVVLANTTANQAGDAESSPDSSTVNSAPREARSASLPMSPTDARPCMLFQDSPPEAGGFFGGALRPGSITPMPRSPNDLPEDAEKKLVLLQNIALRRSSASDKELLGALAKANLNLGVGLDARDAGTASAAGAPEDAVEALPSPPKKTRPMRRVTFSPEGSGSSPGEALGIKSPRPRRSSSMDRPPPPRLPRKAPLSLDRSPRPHEREDIPNSPTSDTSSLSWGSPRPRVSLSHAGSSPPDRSKSPSQRNPRPRLRSRAVVSGRTIRASRESELKTQVRGPRDQDRWVEPDIEAPRRDGTQEQVAKEPGGALARPRRGFAL